MVYPYISIVSKLLASLLFEHLTSHIKNNCRIRNVYQSHMCFQEKWRCKTNLNCLRSFFHLQVVMENPLPAKFIQCAVLNCSLLLTGCCSKNMAIYFNREFFQATELSSLEIYFLLHNWPFNYLNLKYINNFPSISQNYSYCDINFLLMIYAFSKNMARVNGEEEVTCLNSWSIKKKYFKMIIFLLV